ncbi:uncharacterized protein [Littorina saxatilis]|uniref:Uncharacterized protein n=1 Tax=Littorina saxatilis TaxID=31220 RepID=A0AAN9GCE0_9CAEN
MASKDFEHNPIDNRYQRTASSFLASDTPEGIQKNIGRSVEQNKPEDSLNLHRQGIKSGAGDITKRTDVLPGHPPLILPPELADSLPAQDALAAEALWWENPALISLFTRVMEFLQLLCVQPECYQLLQELLKDIGHGIGEFTLPQGAKVAHFAAYLGFADKCFLLYQEVLRSQRLPFYPDTKTPTRESGETIQCLFCVRIVLMRFTHRSPIFCELLVETGMLWFLLKDLEHMYHCHHDELAESSVFLQSIGCLQNCCRHSDVLCVAKEIVQAVSPFLSSPNKKIRMMALMTLAHVVDEGQYDTDMGFFRKFTEFRKFLGSRDHS